jgi:hypothetical protein
MRRSIGWKVGLTVAAIHILYTGSYLGDPMATSILDLTVSLVDRGRLDIDRYAGNSLDVARRGDHYYSGMAPGVSIAAVPFYLAAKPALALVVTDERERRVDELFLKAKTSWHRSEKRLTILLLNAFTCALGSSALAGAMAALFHLALGLIHPGLDDRRRLVTTWLFSFGTLFFCYAATLEHRVLSTTLCFAAFVGLIAPEGPSPRRRALLCGLALGFAVATTYEVALVAAAVALFGLSRKGRRWPWAWLLLGGAAVALPLAAYHSACFGAPWKTPYGARAFPLSAPPAFLHQPGPALGRAADLLIGRRYGFFFYSPPLLLALPALARLRRGDPHRGVVALAFGNLAGLLAFHYLTGYDGVPGEFGFRFMLPAIPFLMLLVPLSYRWSYRVAVPALALSSLAIVGKGVMFGPARDRSFWGNYPELLARYGLSNYTLANLKDHALTGLQPLAVTAIHLAALGAILVGLRLLVWRHAEDSPQGTRGDTEEYTMN